MFVRIDDLDGHVVHYGDVPVKAAGCIGWMRYDEPVGFAQVLSAWCGRIVQARRHGESVDDELYGVLRMAADMGVCNEWAVPLLAGACRERGCESWDAFAGNLESARVGDSMWEQDH